MRPAVWLGVVAGVLAPAAGAAAAAPAVFELGTATRFALAGDRVALWSGDATELALRDPDGAVRVLHRAASRRGTEAVVSEVSATPTRVAFVTEGFDVSGDGGAAWSSVRAGPLGGPFGLVAGRERAGGSRPGDVAIADAGLLVSDRRGVALLPAGGGAPVRLGGTGLERLAVGGRWAVARSASHVALLDLEARTVVRRLAVAADPSSRVPATAGVAADGTLAVTDARRRLWAVAPSGRRTLLLHDAIAVVRVAGSTAYVVQRTGDHEDQLRRLWAVDLAGGDPRRVTEAVFGGEFATDGVHVLHSRGRCGVLAEPVVPERAPATDACPRQPLRLHADERRRSRRMPMRVTCPGAPADRCTGTVRLSAPRAGGRDRVLLGTWRFAAAGGEVVRTTLRISATQLALAHRRAGRIVARLRATGTPLGRVERRVVFEELPSSPERVGD